MAVKCRHCGEFLSDSIRSEKNERAWQFKDGTVIGALLFLLPLALPLVWFNPYYSRRNKIIISIIVGVVTYITWITTAKAFESLGEYYKMLM